MSRLTEENKALLDASMRDRIFDSTLRVLEERGIRKLTMSRVAETAGVAKGSLYNYFRNKHDLMRFVHERAYAPIRQRITEIRAAGHTAVMQLELMARNWFESVGKNRGLFHFLLNDEALRGELKGEQESLRVEFLNDLSATIQQGIEEGDLRPMPAGMVAEMLMGAVRELSERELATGQSRPVDETVSRVLEVFLTGIEFRGVSARIQGTE